MWSKKEADTSIRGLPFYIKKETFTQIERKQKVCYIVSLLLVLTMLCVIFRFSAANATQSSHLSEGLCIRLVRDLCSVFPEQFPTEKAVKIAQMIEFPIRKCAHFTEYAVLSITVNLHLWVCYWLEGNKCSKKEKKRILSENCQGIANGTRKKEIAEAGSLIITERSEKAIQEADKTVSVKIWNFILRAEIFCAFYACTDELHQYFVPGRSCRFFDVCVDSTGAFFGGLLFSAVFLWRSARGKRQEISKKSKS